MTQIMDLRSRASEYNSIAQFARDSRESGFEKRGDY